MTIPKVTSPPRLRENLPNRVTLQPNYSAFPEPYGSPPSHGQS